MIHGEKLLQVNPYLCNPEIRTVILEFNALKFEMSDLHPTEGFYHTKNFYTPIVSLNVNSALERLLGRENFKKYEIEPQMVKKFNPHANCWVASSVSIPATVMIHRYNCDANLRLIEKMQVSSPGCVDNLYGSQAEATTIYSLTKPTGSRRYQITGGCVFVESEGIKVNTRLLELSELKTERIESIFDRIERSLLAGMID